MKAVVYEIKNTKTNERYVGSTTLEDFENERRWKKHRQHLSRNNHDNTTLQKAWNAYGEESFEMNVMEQCTSRKAAYVREQWYFDNMWSECHYNILPVALSPVIAYAGNRKGKTNSVAHRKAISEGNKGKELSQATKDAISLANVGRPVSAATREIHRLNSTGYEHTQAAKDAISVALTGKPKSEAHKKNMSIAQSGSKNGMYGKKQTKEARAKMVKNSGTRGKPTSDAQKAAASAAQKLRWANAPTLVCDHCGYETKNSGMLKRWHQDNCKKNVLISTPV